MYTRTMIRYTWYIEALKSIFKMVKAIGENIVNQGNILAC